MSNLMDLHVYTNNSPAAKDKISYLCESAVEKELRAVAFTDIIELDKFSFFEGRRRLRHSFFDMSKARQMFFDDLSVFSGIEIRQAYLHKEEAAQILSAQEYDIVLTAVTRFADGEEFGIGPDISQEQFHIFAEKYASALLATVEQTDFDVLSGLVSPLRNCRLDFTFFEENLKKVLVALARREKALEINTRDIGGSDKVRDLYFRLISYFQEAGGKYVTVGSECCFRDEIGRGIDLGVLTAKRAGFPAVTFYNKRLPYQIGV